MTTLAAVPFVKTLPYQSFQAFCDACLRQRCIGVCYGQTGVGKTISARHYADWDKVSSYPRYNVCLREVIGSNVVVYTVPVANTPVRLLGDLSTLLGRLRGFLIEDLYRQEHARLEELKLHEENDRQAILAGNPIAYSMFQKVEERACEARRQIQKEFALKRNETKNPTELVIIDEADRFTMPTLKEAVALFDRGGIGMVLLGMPGLEKRISRNAQMYSRIGFIHEFRPLSCAEVYHVLKQEWWPAATARPQDRRVDAESMAAIVGITGGNFRRLHRLLQQIGRVMEMTGSERMTREVVATAQKNVVMVG